jgi:hypothetical protein
MPDVTDYLAFGRDGLIYAKDAEIDRGNETLTAIGFVLVDIAQSLRASRPLTAAENCTCATTGQGFCHIHGAPVNRRG